jgi:hypothetical protein
MILFIIEVINYQIVTVVALREEFISIVVFCCGIAFGL